MPQFSLAQSGLFSAGDYNEETKTLSVTFRTSGVSYEVRGVDAELGNRFMSQAGKSDIWIRELRPMGTVRV